MSDMAAIRRENLRRLCTSHGLGPAALSRAYEDSPSPPYWSDLLRGRKDFGEKTARAIEEGLSLPRNWLDQSGEPLPVHRATSKREYSRLGGLAAKRLDAMPPGQQQAVYLMWMQIADGVSSLMTAHATESVPETGDAGGQGSRSHD